MEGFPAQNASHGARQVGKSWLVKTFANQFERFIEINFDEDPDAAQLFAGKLDVESILQKIALYTGTQISYGKTLIFLDEIGVPCRIKNASLF